MISYFTFSTVLLRGKHVVESTPLLKEAEMSKNRTRAGKSTLKKELWIRSKETSMHGNHFSSKTMTTTKRRNNKKGFMEMLEEERKLTS